MAVQLPGFLPAIHYLLLFNLFWDGRLSSLVNLRAFGIETVSVLHAKLLATYLDSYMNYITPLNKVFPKLAWSDRLSVVSLMIGSESAIRLSQTCTLGRMMNTASLWRHS